MRIGRGIAARPITHHATFSDHLSETFTGSDAQLTAADVDLVWGVVQNPAGLDVVSNKARGTVTGPNRARAEHLLNVSDMWCEADAMGSDKSATQNMNLALRVNEQPNATLDMYVAQFQLSSANGTVTFFRTVDGTSTNIASANFFPGVGFTEDQVYRVRFEAVGTVLTAYVDSVQALTFDDSSPPGGFTPGLFAGFATQDSTASGFVEVDDWEAGTVFAADTVLQIDTPGALTFSGQNVAARISSPVTPAALTFSGQSIAATITAPITAGALSFTGQTIGLVTSSPVTVGALAFSGQTINTAVSVVLQITTPGALTFTGQTTAALISSPLSPGALTFTGQSITTTVAVTLQVSPGALTFSGQTSPATISSSVTAGALVFSGQTSPARISSPVSPGALVFAGQSIPARIASPITVGTLVFSGQSINTTGNTVLSVSPGALTFSGQSVLARFNAIVSAGTLAFSGQTSPSRITNTLTPGALAFSGQNTLARFLAAVAPGALVFSGQSITLSVTGAGLGTVVKGSTGAQGAPGRTEATGAAGITTARGAGKRTTVIEV